MDKDKPQCYGILYETNHPDCMICHYYSECGKVKPEEKKKPTKAIKELPSGDKPLTIGEDIPMAVGEDTEIGPMEISDLLDDEMETTNIQKTATKKFKELKNTVVVIKPNDVALYASEIAKVLTSRGKCVLETTPDGTIRVCVPTGLETGVILTVGEPTAVIVPTLSQYNTQYVKPKKIPKLKTTKEIAIDDLLKNQWKENEAIYEAMREMGIPFTPTKNEAINRATAIGKIKKYLSNGGELLVK